MKLYLVVQRYREGRKRLISRWVALAGSEEQAIERVTQEDHAQVIAGFPFIVQEYGSNVVSGKLGTHEVDRYPPNWQGPF